MAVVGKRDFDDTQNAVAHWLGAQLGVDTVEISELSLPKAGFSNETIFLTAAWDHDGERERHELVLRIEPTGHQLFVKPDAIFQANMMAELGRHPGTPAPRIWFTETDASILGAPFFLMQRSHGRIPGDVPSWHAKGWTTELSSAQVSRLYDNGLAALVALHRIDVRDGFQFLERGRAGHALAAYLTELESWYEWCAPSRVFDADALDMAYRYLQANPPDDRAEGIVWGDARPGNLIFDDNLEVVAMIDWETATLGPPGIDLGWWLMFEDFLSDAQGVPRLNGAPDRDAIIGRYEQLSGRAMPDIDYYEMLACVVMSLINSRLGALLMKSHNMSDEQAGEWARRSIRMAGRRLDAIMGRA